MKLTRIGILAGLAGGLLAAADGTTTLRSPGLGQLSRKQFQQLFSKSFRTDSGTAARLGAHQHSCSIPLEEAKIEHPERFSMRRMPVGPLPGRPALVDPGIVTPTSAPTCKNWNPGK